MNGRYVAYDERTRLEQFEAKYVPEPNTGCWLWTGATIGDGRYGQYWDGRRKLPAHRWSYMAMRGPIGDGLQLDHRCRTTLCVNPWHLEAVTARVNTLRSTAITAAFAHATHCVKGHELAGDNLHVRTSDGARICRRCRNDRSIAYAKKHRARLSELERERRRRP